MKTIRKDEIKSRRGGQWYKWLCSTISILNKGGSVFVPISSRNPDLNFEILEQLRSIDPGINMEATYKDVNDFCLSPFVIVRTRTVKTGYVYIKDMPCSVCTENDAEPC